MSKPPALPLRLKLVLASQGMAPVAVKAAVVQQLGAQNAALLAPHQLQATRTAEGGWAVHRARPGAAAEHALPTVNVLADAEHLRERAQDRHEHHGLAAAGDDEKIRYK